MATTTRFSSTYTFDTARQKMRASESDDNLCFADLATAEEKMQKLYDKHLSGAQLKAAVEEVRLTAQGKSAMEKLTGFTKLVEIQVSEKEDAAEAAAENRTRLIASDLRTCFPPCDDEGVMEGIRDGELRATLRVQGRFIDGDDRETLETAYLEMTEGPLLGPALVDSALAAEGVDWRDPAAPWPYLGFGGPQEQGEGDGGGGTPAKPLSMAELVQQKMRERAKGGKTPARRQVGFTSTSRTATARGEALVKKGEELEVWAQSSGRSEGLKALEGARKKFLAKTIDPDEYEELLDEATEVQEKEASEEQDEEDRERAAEALEALRTAALGKGVLPSGVLKAAGSTPLGGGLLGGGTFGTPGGLGSAVGAATAKTQVIHAR